MKKIILLLMLSMPVILLAQNDTLSNEEMAAQIKFFPTEVTASVVLDLNFESAQEVRYKVFQANTLVQEQTIEKSTAALMKKLDFSTLPAGPYTVKIYVAETEIKEFSITKL